MEVAGGGAVHVISVVVCGSACNQPSLVEVAGGGAVHAIRVVVRGSAYNQPSLGIALGEQEEGEGMAGREVGRGGWVPGGVVMCWGGTSGRGHVTSGRGHVTSGRGHATSGRGHATSGRGHATSGRVT